MTLRNMLAYIKTFGLFKNYGASKIDASKEKTLGLYVRNSTEPRVQGVGQPSSYLVNHYTALVHWSKYGYDTQEAAQRLYDALLNTTDTDTGTNYIDYIDMLYGEPMAIGTDANDIYEYVIDFDVYSRRIYNNGNNN